MNFTFKDTRKIFILLIFFSLLNTLNTFIDNIIAGRMGEQETIAIGVVSFIIAIFNSLFYGIYSLFGGAILNNIALNTKQKQKTINFSFFAMLFISLLILLIAFIFQNHLVGMRIKDNVIAEQMANKYFWFGVFSTILLGFNLYFDLFLNYKRKVVQIIVFNVLNITINFIISYILVFEYDLGVIGAGIGTISSLFVFFVVKLLYVKIVIFEDENIKFPLYKIFDWNKKTLKQFKHTWIYFPYEFIYFALGFLISLVTNRMFDDGLVGYSVAAPFFFIFVNATGISMIILSEVPKMQKTEQDIKKLLRISVLRAIGLFVLIYLPMALIIRFSGFYNKIEPTDLNSAFWIMLLVGGIYTIGRPVYNYTYKLAFLKMKPLMLMIIDLSLQTISLVILFSTSYIGTGLWFYTSAAAIHAFNSTFTVYFIESVILKIQGQKRIILKSNN